jgi:hypothetical protein
MFTNRQREPELNVPDVFFVHNSHIIFNPRQPCIDRLPAIGFVFAIKPIDLQQGIARVIGINAPKNMPDKIFLSIVNLNRGINMDGFYCISNHRPESTGSRCNQLQVV